VSKENDGGPAFPLQIVENYQEGMSLRDYFAAKAMQGYMMSPFTCEQVAKSNESLAVWSYETADAMLAERNK
jgi:hypothetical protein